MTIEKKSLISSLKTTKKANVAKEDFSPVGSANSGVKSPARHSAARIQAAKATPARMNLAKLSKGKTAPARINLAKMTKGKAAPAKISLARR
jgi:hypothetical protein